MSISYFKLLLGLVPLLMCVMQGVQSTESNVHQKSGFGDRPQEVQDAVDRAFEAMHDETVWYRNGNSEYYTLMGSDEDKLFEYLLKRSDKKDIYIFDVGCGKGRWGENTFKILQQEEYKKSGKRFHIFSITGGKECEQLTTEHDNVILHQLNQVKIENIDEELSARGFNLEGKVDLIVSDWTLRHLADPFGTLKRLYNLLTPQDGMLLSNGFLFKYDDSDEVKTFPYCNEEVLVNTQAASLFRRWRESRDAGQFLLMRKDNRKLEIPLEYTGSMHTLKGRWQCESGAVTVFKRKPHKEKITREKVNSKKDFYCHATDQRCKDLYEQFKDLLYISNWDE